MEEKALYLSECTLVMKGIEPGLYVFSGYSKMEPQGVAAQAPHFLPAKFQRCILDWEEQDRFRLFGA